MDLLQVQSLIEKYKLGQCTAEEQVLLDKWFETLGETTKISALADEATVKQQMWQNIVAQTDLATPEAGPMLAFRRSSWRRIAATVIGLAGLGLIGWMLFVRNQPAAMAMQVIRNPEGKQTTLSLPDGSTVYLNAASVLEIPEKFQGATREVKLTGEAFFEIAKNPDRPFIVRSGNIATTVLGTSFNIRAYPDEPTVTVAVATGHVGVSDSTTMVRLLPDEQAVYTRANRSMEKQTGINAISASAWTKGLLVFEDAPLAEIVRVLNRKYGVQIRLDNPALAKCALNASFGNEPLEKVLEKICAYIDARHERSDNEIIISGKGCF